MILPMLPVIQILGLLRIYSFGLFLALAFLFGLFVFWKKGREEHFDEALLLDAAITACFWGFIGARIGFILVNFQVFGLNILDWFSLFAYPGFVGIFGLMSAIISLVIFSKKQKWDTYEVLDFGTLGLSIGLVFVFIGMFLNGSGFGNTTTLPIGMSFPGVFDRRHPVQLYDALLYLIVFISLMKLELEYRAFLWYRAKKRSAQSGFLLACFLMAYGGISGVLSFVKPFQFVIFGIPLDPFIGLLIIVVGISILYRRSGREFPIFRTKKK